MEPERDSEEGIIASEPGAPIYKKGPRVRVRGRSPSGIFIKKEFSVDENLSKSNSRTADRSSPGSVSGDKADDKVPFSHI